MIKNEIQAQKTENRLLEIRKEIEEARRTYPADEVEFWTWTLEDEAKNYQSELDDYHLLKKTRFEVAVEKLLQEPILLENISELLASLRIAAKLTQKEMAQRLNWQQPNVSRFENENYSSQSIDKISEYVGALGIWLYIQPSLSERKPLLKIKRANVVPEIKWIVTSQQPNESTKGSAHILECDEEIEWVNDSLSTFLSATFSKDTILV